MTQRDAEIAWGSLDPSDCHYWLTQAMARTAGVSLVGAIAERKISENDFVGMVARCCACKNSDSCVQWMAGGAAAAQDVPAYCLNHEIIEALRDT